MTRDVLDELIIDEDVEPNLNLLADLVKTYMKFSRTGDIIYEDNFRSNPEWKRVMLFLLGRKIIFIKKLGGKKEEPTLKEISEGAFSPTKNITRIFNRELKSIVKPIERGLYIIPNYNLLKCKNLLEGKSKISWGKNKKLK
jgi:hypothetical protein